MKDLRIFIRVIFFMLGSVFAGYTITNFNKDFLKKMVSPLSHFIIGIILSASFFNFTLESWKNDWKTNFLKLLSSGLIFTVILFNLKKYTDK